MDTVDLLGNAVRAKLVEAHAAGAGGGQPGERHVRQDLREGGAVFLHYHLLQFV